MISSTPATRDATEADLPAIQSIYAHHVRNSIATFEISPPTLDEMRLRYLAIRREGKPYLVAYGADGLLAGYCYASTYRVRPAYDYTVEDTIYLAPGQEGRGMGTVLLRALLERCAAGPWRQMVAVISGHGSAASVALHRKLGFEIAGTLLSVGYKHDQWIDTILMQRALGPGDSQPPSARQV